MDVRRVVPDTGKIRGPAVEDDFPAYEHNSLDEALDCPELMGHVQDGHVELAVQLLEERPQRLLARGVSMDRAPPTETTSAVSTSGSSSR